jgi:hypothetical protein
MSLRHGKLPFRGRLRTKGLSLLADHAKVSLCPGTSPSQGGITPPRTTGRRSTRCRLTGSNSRGGRASTPGAAGMVRRLGLLARHLGSGPCKELGRKPRVVCLPLTDGESKQLLELARIHGIVRALDDSRNVCGDAVDPEWIPTDRGLRLARPRGASPDDLWRAGLATFDQIREALRDWWPLLVLEPQNRLCRRELRHRLPHGFR